MTKVTPLIGEEIETLRNEHGWLNILHPESGASITVCSECYNKTDECVPWPCEVARLVAALDDARRATADEIDRLEMFIVNRAHLLEPSHSVHVLFRLWREREKSDG